MTLNLIRFVFTDKSTIGKLDIDGVFECYTLERPSDGKNIPEQSSILEGTYEVRKRWSNHLGQQVLGLCGVPGRTDIEIHIANFPNQILGCIAVGKIQGRDSVGKSTIAFNDLMAKFKDPCSITITSQPTVAEPPANMVPVE